MTCTFVLVCTGEFFLLGVGCFDSLYSRCMPQTIRFQRCACGMYRAQGSLRGKVNFSIRCWLYAGMCALESEREISGFSNN